MMTASDENLKRAYQQMQVAVKESVNDQKPYCYGLGVCFITFVLATTKQLADEGRLTADGELAHKAAITNSKLHVSQSEIDANKDGADPIKATLRHLRNCVAHGNWNYNPADKTPSGA